SVWFFSSFSVIGPLANLFAIPVVTFLMTPAALVGAALAMGSGAVASVVLRPAVWLTERLLEVLEPMSEWPLSTIVIAQPSMALLLLAALGGAWIFAPRAVPARWLGLLLLMPSMVVPRERPPLGVLWLTAYDVGQGSALLVETATQTLLYDTGPRMGPAMDAGSRVVVPSLRARGIDRLDKLMISHADEDHIGGAASVLRDLDVVQTYASLPPDHPMQSRIQSCHEGLRWVVDGVRFDVLHPFDPPVARPARAAGSATNAMSCVLSVTAPGGRVLLTGDLEAPQERALLERLGPEGLRSDILIVPHHGSKTSSTPEFLSAVAPLQAVFQLGWHNHYRHPHPKVLERYDQAAIPILRTDRDGAIRISLQAGEPPQISKFRVDEARYWRVAQPWRVSDRLTSEALPD
ncbi:MAG: DNA internalization-related competence protein ComEC/Rec2, partial [Betaproteobacteria bacterium]|nr:DNA internalization-related competence protein ComEC/Rec2 [Betaproteobacteria bacterium]